MILKNNSESRLLNDNVIEFSTTQKEFQIIWFSDAHLDNPKTKLSFFHKTLQENPEAFIIMGGDNHDLMQGKDDKRRNKSDLKVDHKKGSYWNQVVKDTRENIISAYSDRIIGWTTGNHETAVLKHIELDFLDMLLDNGRLGNRLYTRGYIIVKYVTSSGTSLIFPIYFQHKPPSGGRKSKGMLSVDELLAQNPDARCIITEDIHTTWMHPIQVERLDNRGNLFNRLVWMIQAPTLKEEFEGKRQGFYHEKIMKGPITIGAIKLNFKLHNGHISKSLKLTPEWILH